MPLVKIIDSSAVSNLFQYEKEDHRRNHSGSNSSFLACMSVIIERLLSETTDTANELTEL